MKTSGIAYCLIVALSMSGCGQQSTSSGPESATPLQEVAAAQPAPRLEAGADTMLVASGQSPYRILLDAKASASEQQAAQDLQTEIAAATGVTLPIETGDAAGDSPSIVVGCGAAAKALGVDPDPVALATQGYVLKTVPPHIVIAGTPGAGTLYGAYDFLERVFGARWLAPGVTVYGHKEVPYPALDELVTPAFLWRKNTYARPGADDAFTARQRENSGTGDADAPYGNKYDFYGTCHTYLGFVGPDEFFATHPEYFSEIGGKRIGFETQLCLTNPDVLDIVTERMLQRMKDRPELDQYNFSQEDYNNYCECAQCRAINEQYGTKGGTQFWFVNQLAERTAKIYPDKLISTLAYMYTEEPPQGMTMHPNVSVWLCHMFPCCDSHPIATCPLNANYKRRAEAWSKQTSHLYVWHYIVDFAHYYNPFPNLRSMAADMRFYKSIGVEGVYQQAMGHSGGGGEFSLLRPYYGVKLLWNPDQDPEAIIDEFLNGYYGPAADPIRRYIALTHDYIDQNNVHIHLYVNPGQGHFPDAILEQADALFDEAEAAVAQDPELLERVKVARMPLTYARLFPRNGYTIAPGPPDGQNLRTATLTFNEPLADAAEVQTFLERMKSHGFNTIREWGGDPAQLGFWPLVFKSPMTLPVIENEHLEVSISPFLGGRALQIVDKKSGQCVTAFNTIGNLYFPFSGGEESRMGGLFAAHMVGNMAPFEVVERSANAVALRTNAGSFDMIRRLTLAPDAPVLTVETIATNTTDKPQEARMRCHLDLDLGAIEQTQIAFTARAGENVSKDMTSILANLREGERYAGPALPNGAWTLTGTKGLSLTQHFNPQTTEFAWIYAYPASLNDIEIEVQETPVMVDPGASHTVKFEYEVR